MTVRNTTKFSLLTATLLLLIASCTTERDGFLYRGFHNMTARYNGFFYANESMKEADVVLLEAHIEDYDEILPIFISGDEDASQGIYPQMERAIEKTTNVIDRHTMSPPKREMRKMEKPEMNKWIDDNWLVMGRAYFYKRNFFKAEEIFRYITRKHKDPNIQAQAFTWMARVYIEREQWIKASNSVIKATQSKKDIDDEIRAETYLVKADYHLRLEELEEAGEALEDALGRIKKKKDRARPTFILAQVKQELGRSQEAINNYEAVLKLKPIYEMEFYSKINQALAYSRRGGNPVDIRETLFKMLKDEKNEEYRDQIYYALADLSFDERDREGGIANLKSSLDANRASDGQVKQRAKAYLRLADVHFEEREYTLAQAYYDSTFTSIDEEHDRFKEIKNLAESLTELVTNLNIIYDQDSLRQFCDLDSTKLERELLKIQRKMERDMEDQRFADELALLNGAATGPSGGASSTFWPYNNALRANGYNNFQDFWGDRPLEDDWRRRNKVQQSFSSGEDQEEIEGSVDIEEKLDFSEKDPYYVPTIEELMMGLPCGNDSLLANSDKLVTEAYYQAGLVYKEKLDDFDNAVEKWEILVTDFDDSDFHPTAFYQLYRSYLAREREGYQSMGCKSCSSAYWAGRISERYPGSEWDKLIKNPDYQDYKEIIEAEERTAYEHTYQEYHYKQYLPVIEMCNTVIDSFPDNHLVCKYRILKAHAVGQMDGMTGQQSNYINELNITIQECPDSEEAQRAREIIDILTKETSDNSAEPEEKTAPEESIYEYNESSKHYFALVFPIKGGDVNKIKASVADFNSKNFKSSTLKTTSNLLGKDKQIVMVKTFMEFPEAQNYFDIFTANTEELDEINRADYGAYLISKENYLTLFKTKNLEAYATFFSSNYDL